MHAVLLAALVGVLHVHHAPSHDSEAPFADVLSAAREIGLDFVVLTEHTAAERLPGPRPAAAREGLYPGSGPDDRPLLVLVGAELGTADGHLLALDLSSLPASRGPAGADRPGRDVIADIHALGGFAAIPHPESHGGWHDWDAPFDALEVQNTASDFSRQMGPLLPLRLLRLAFAPRAGLDALWVRPDAELARWEALLASGRRVVALAGADAHRNVSVLGWQLDPYERSFAGAQMVCPDGRLEAAEIWKSLRAGHCYLRWHHYTSRAGEASRVGFPSGHWELRLDDGQRVLEVHPPPPPAPTSGR